MSTNNLGLFQLATTSPDYENGNSPIAQVSAALATLDNQKGVTVYSASGAIAVTQGTVFLTKTTAAAMTLALPTAGLPSAGGNDGQTIRVFSSTAHAHTITTPPAGINGAHTVITYAAVGDCCELTAYNGSWWFSANTPTNVTITT